MNIPIIYIHANPHLRCQHFHMDRTSKLTVLASPSTASSFRFAWPPWTDRPTKMRKPWSDQDFFVGKGIYHITGILRLGVYIIYICIHMYQSIGDHPLILCTKDAALTVAHIILSEIENPCVWINKRNTYIVVI